jgi:biotin carboxyl carrier protein
MAKKEELQKDQVSSKFIALTNKGMKYEFYISEDNIIRYKNKILNISINESEGFTFIEFGNKRYPVEIIDRNQNKYEVLINNVSYTFTVETPFSFKRRQLLTNKQEESKTENIIAPLPGKILEIIVEEGALVHECEAVLILEAMKMQNEITSQFTGKVKKIFIKTGDTVMKDDVLMEIEKG